MIREQITSMPLDGADFENFELFQARVGANKKLVSDLIRMKQALKHLGHAEAVPNLCESIQEVRPCEGTLLVKLDPGCPLTDVGPSPHDESHFLAEAFTSGGGHPVMVVRKVF